MRAADALEQAGIDAEIIDLRCLSPWDERAVITSAEHTARLIVVHEDNHSCGVGAEIVATVAEKTRVPVAVRRVTRPDTHVPCNFANQIEVLPSFKRVLSAAAELLDFELSWIQQAAEESGLDLVEVAPNATPPVCRIMDYGKYRYQQAKKTKDAKKKQTVIHVKEVKLRPKTEEHDIQYKTANIKRFLADGNRVKVTIQFRGREIAHPDMAQRVIDRVLEGVEGIGVVDQRPKREGRRMIFVLRPAAGKP